MSWQRVGNIGYRSARRIAIGVIGATLLLLGAVLLVIPGPGLLVIGLGLAVLGVEFAWARRWLRSVRETASSAARNAGRFVSKERDRPGGAPRPPD